MASWRKIFTSNDIIPVANGGTGVGTQTVGGVVTDGDSIDGVEQTSGEILIGQSSSQVPVAYVLSGDVTMTNTGNVTISNNAVETGMIQANAVTLAELAHATKGDIITFNSSGEPVYLNAGSDGQVLKANSSATNGYGIEWDTAGTATNLNVVDGDTQTNPLPVTFASQIGTATVYVDDDEFTFDPTATFADEGTTQMNGGPTQYLENETDGAGRAALFSKNGFKGDLAGVASGSKESRIGEMSGVYSLVGVATGVSPDNYAQLHRAGESDTILQWDTTAGKLTVGGDLEVTGTTTTVDSTVVEIADASLKLAAGATDSSNAQASAAAVAAGGVGIVVDNGSAADGNLGRIVYSGYNSSDSVLGWKIAQERDVNATTPTLGPWGVGVMYTQTGAMTENAALNIGVGAMTWTSNSGGELWIQTAI